MLQYFDYAKFWYYTRANHIILVGWLDGLVWGGGGLIKILLKFVKAWSKRIYPSLRSQIWFYSGPKDKLGVSNNVLLKLVNILQLCNTVAWLNAFTSTDYQTSINKQLHETQDQTIGIHTFQDLCSTKSVQI